MTSSSRPRRLLTFLAAAGLVVAVGVAAPVQAEEPPTCFGLPATIVGTDGDDSLRGEVDQVDVIVLGPGNDRLEGLGEEGPRSEVGDYVCGGPGRDGMYGTAGGDHLSGGAGSDSIYSWRGADVVRGKAGNDYLEEDSIDSQDSQTDVLRGGKGDDHVDGGWGADRLYGHGGNDVLRDWECGGTGLFGGAGDDRMRSYLSSFEGFNCYEAQPADFVRGGSGDDSAAVLDNDSVTGVETVVVRRYYTG